VRSWRYVDRSPPGSNGSGICYNYFGNGSEVFISGSPSGRMWLTRRRVTGGRVAGATIGALLALSACAGPAPRPERLPSPPGPALAEPGPSREDCLALPAGQGSPRSGVQTSQFRPLELSGRKYELGLPGQQQAVWNTAPRAEGLQSPIVLNVDGSNAVASDTCLIGGMVHGNLDLAQARGDQYNDYHSGIEQGNDRADGFAVADGVRVERMLDGYRFIGRGAGPGAGAYLKRFYGSDLRDDCLERDEFTGDVYVYDSLFEGCYSGISAIGLPAADGARTVLDKVLMWIKPTTDRRHSASGDWCRTPEGCHELETRHAGSFAIWKGEANAPNVVEVRNSWFRLDRRTVWGIEGMAWPCTPGSTWGTGTTCTYRNVKVLWTGEDPYPGPPLPAGVELVTGARARTMWDTAAAAWKAEHGYRT
jgi:hypothetical protein